MTRTDTTTPNGSTPPSKAPAPPSAATASSGEQTAAAPAAPPGITPTPVPPPNSPEGRALGLAWFVWAGMILVPLAVLGIALYLTLMTAPTAARPGLGGRWSWGVVAWLMIAVPGAFFCRGQIFKNYWRGEGVSPGRYLAGMSLVWGALSIGALLGGIAMLGSRMLFPNVALAIVAIVVLMTLWPKGNAMTRPVGDPEEPGQYDMGDYQEPR